VHARGTAVLLGILAALAGWLWLIELHPRHEPPAAGPPPLLDVPPSAIARIELADDGPPIVAVRNAGGWTDDTGRAWSGGVPADLLATLTTLRPLMVVDPDPSRPADFGLGPGAAHLRVLAPDGHALLALELGDRNPAWTGLYARRDGRREILLLGGVLNWEMTKLRQSAPTSRPLTTEVETREPGDPRGGPR
jgi:hypothetical protein